MDEEVEEGGMAVAEEEGREGIQEVDNREVIMIAEDEGSAAHHHRLCAAL
jgi:hypothetical protein